jgi:hypothetical protein
MEAMRNAYEALVEKSEGGSSLGRPWEDNIEMHVRVIRCEAAD